MDPGVLRDRSPRVGGMIATAEAPQQVMLTHSLLRSVTRSVAVIVEAPRSVLEAVPPREFDSQIEEPMDESAIAALDVPQHPAEAWPEGSGPFGF